MAVKLNKKATIDEKRLNAELEAGESTGDPKYDKKKVRQFPEGQKRVPRSEVKKLRKPEKKTKKAEKKTGKTRRPRSQQMIDGKIKVMVKENPKKRGAAKKRFDAYFKSKTVAEALKKGVTQSDLRWDSEHNFIKIEKPVYKTKEE